MIHCIILCTTTLSQTKKKLCRMEEKLTALPKKCLLISALVVLLSAVFTEFFSI